MSRNDAKARNLLVSRTARGCGHVSFAGLLWICGGRKVRPRFDWTCGPFPAESALLLDLHSNSKADFIRANPPFNMNDWSGENLRQQSGMPPVNKANYGWVQHFNRAQTQTSVTVRLPKLLSGELDPIHENILN